MAEEQIGTSHGVEEVSSKWGEKLCRSVRIWQVSVSTGYQNKVRLFGYQHSVGTKANDEYPYN